MPRRKRIPEEIARKTKMRELMQELTSTICQASCIPDFRL